MVISFDEALDTICGDHEVKKSKYHWNSKKIIFEENCKGSGMFLEAIN